MLFNQPFYHVMGVLSANVLFFPQLKKYGNKQSAKTIFIYDRFYLNGIDSLEWIDQAYSFTSTPEKPRQGELKRDAILQETKGTQ